MQLGLFFTGVSPSGGASNTWSVILGGNLDLSISMTTISTLKAFGMGLTLENNIGITILNCKRVDLLTKFQFDIPSSGKKLEQNYIALILHSGQSAKIKCFNFLY